MDGKDNLQIGLGPGDYLLHEGGFIGIIIANVYEDYPFATQLGWGPKRLVNWILCLEDNDLKLPLLDSGRWDNYSRKLTEEEMILYKLEGKL